MTTDTPSEKVNLNINENRDNKYVPAGFWIRFIAQLIDALILSIIQYPVTIPISLMIAKINNPINALFLSSSSWIFTLIINFFYSGWFYTKRGATPGKMIFNIKVLDAETGQYLTWGQCFLRDTVGKFFSTALLLFGYIIAAFRRDKKSLHDLIAGTQCIRQTLK